MLYISVFKLFGFDEIKRGSLFDI